MRSSWHCRQWSSTDCRRRDTCRDHPAVDCYAAPDHHVTWRTWIRIPSPHVVLSRPGRLWLWRHGRPRRPGAGDTRGEGRRVTSPKQVPGVEGQEGLRVVPPQRRRRAGAADGRPPRPRRRRGADGHAARFSKPRPRGRPTRATRRRRGADAAAVCRGAGRRRREGPQPGARAGRGREDRSWPTSCRMARGCPMRPIRPNRPLTWGTAVATWMARSTLIASGREPDDFAVAQTDRWLRTVGGRHRPGRRGRRPRPRASPRT